MKIQIPKLTNSQRETCSFAAASCLMGLMGKNSAGLFGGALFAVIQKGTEPPLKKFGMSALNVIYAPRWTSSKTRNKVREVFALLGSYAIAYTALCLAGFVVTPYQLLATMGFASTLHKVGEIVFRSEPPVASNAPYNSRYGHHC